MDLCELYKEILKMLISQGIFGVNLNIHISYRRTSLVVLCLYVKSAAHKIYHVANFDKFYLLFGNNKQQTFNAD